jgi:hypothetical protein
MACTTSHYISWIAMRGMNLHISGTDTGIAEEVGWSLPAGEHEVS